MKSIEAREMRTSARPGTAHKEIKTEKQPGDRGRRDCINQIRSSSTRNISKTKSMTHGIRKPRGSTIEDINRVWMGLAEWWLTPSHRDIESKENMLRR